MKRIVARGPMCAAVALAVAACPPSLHVATVGPPVVAEGTLFPDADGDTLFGVPVMIHGHPFNFVLDHGSDASWISDAALDTLHRPARYANATRVVVLTRHHPGEVLAVDTTANEIIRAGDQVTEYWGDFPPVVLDSVRIGRSLQRDLHFPGALGSGLAPFHGLFGLDVMSQFDLEFDVTADKVRLYERVPTSRITHDAGPPWLPPGMSPRDCVAARIMPLEYKTRVDSVLRKATQQALAQGSDTGDAADARRDVIAAIGQQMWNEEQMLLPVALNGDSILAEFDSGIDETIINWLEAARLGITRTSLDVHPRVEAFTRFGQPGTSYIANVTLTIRGPRTLALSPTPIRITDTKFASPTSGPDSLPRVLIGLDQFRDHTLFLSYSTGSVCVSR